jgi:hypothetical protein
VEERSGCGGVVAASAGVVVAGGVRWVWRRSWRRLPYSMSSASPCCSFDSAGSGWWLGSSASWPSSGWETAGRRWLAEGWRSSEPTFPGLSFGEVLVSGVFSQGEFGGGLWRTAVSTEFAISCEDLSCGLSAAGFSGSVVTVAAGGCCGLRVLLSTPQGEDLSLTSLCWFAGMQSSVSRL